jgi:hypothetical protein
MLVWFVCEACRISEAKSIYWVAFANKLDALHIRLHIHILRKTRINKSSRIVIILTPYSTFSQ